MYAIVEIAGQQFKVEEGKNIFVHRLEAEEGSTVEFDKVLLVEDNDKIIVGEPVISEFVVEGKVVDSTIRGEKVIVFKKKRKTGFRLRNGHRQNFSEIEIISIGERGAERKPAPEKKAKKAASPKVTEEPAADKKETAKKTAAKKPTVKADASDEKKQAAKKPATKKASKSKE